MTQFSKKEKLFQFVHLKIEQLNIFHTLHRQAVSLLGKIENYKLKISASSMKSKVVAIAIFSLVASPLSVSAVMQSQSYRIFENVLQEFSGPVISAVASTAGENTATIGWQTDVNADGFVIYDTNASFTAPKEQGNSAKSGSLQSVELAGLSAATTYYYRVRSTSLYGGTTIDPTVRSFTTAADSTPPPAPVIPQSGGGILIIDKRDQVKPLITQVAVSAIKSDSAIVTWMTDEKANSFVAYGKTSANRTEGQWDLTQNHSVNLIQLEPATKYDFFVMSSDESGNLSTSSIASFITLDENEQPVDEPITSTKEPTVTDLASALEKARTVVEKFSTSVTVEVLRNDLTKHLTALDFFNRLLPAPAFYAQPKVVIEGTTATISWLTSEASNSTVALAPEASYRTGAAEPYQEFIGNSNEQVTSHEVKIVNLKPSTTYHYQLRSKSRIGPEAKSSDFTFSTNKEGLEIMSYTVKMLSPESAQFRWITSDETTASLRYIPYRGNKLAVDEAKNLISQTESMVHEVVVNNLEGGMIYKVELSGKDKTGRVATKIIDPFSTDKDNLPPVIVQVRTDSVMVPGKEERIQVIISWQTNEAATSLVHFQKGIAAKDTDPKEKTAPDNNYTRRHVIVIPKLEAGQVYSFRVESADSSENVTKSQLYSILTPKKKETIFDIILRILEQTFGWVGTVGK